jgi:hypothetical protein
MPEYRVFRLDDAGKILGPSQAVRFESDQDAITETRKALNGATLEIWEGPRRIATLRPGEVDPPRI